MKFPGIVWRVLAASLALQASVASGADGDADRGLIDLWEQGQPAFGLYVTQPHGEGQEDSAVPPTFSVETGRDLARNPLLDFAFLSLEAHYDVDSARNVAEGIAGASNDGALPLLVRIPPISDDGADAARARVKEVLELGADGVVIPHVMSLEEARTAVSFFEGVNVWSPGNRDGDIVAMLIVEDPDVFAQLEEIASIPGYSALVCGIGSLTSALGGDTEAAEAINLRVLEQSKTSGLVDLITVNEESVVLRAEQGFLGLLAYGPTADEVLRIGRAAVGRELEAAAK